MVRAEQVEEVAVAVVLHRDRVLVARRPAEKHLGGKDEFPGGHRDSHESLEECVRREVKEETGYDVVPVRLLAQKIHRYPEKTVWLWFFECRLEERGDRPPPRVPRGGRWVLLRDLPSLDFPEANERVVAFLSGAR